jgi:hypothetical protein
MKGKITCPIEPESFHEDIITLRRELVGYGSMKRVGGGGDYWVEVNKGY